MHNRDGLYIFTCQYGDQCSLPCFFSSSRDPRDNGGSNGTRGDVTPGGSQSSSSHACPLDALQCSLAAGQSRINNIKIRPRNGGPNFNDMSALCHIPTHQSTGQEGAAIASSSILLRESVRVSHTWESSGGRGRCGGGCIGPHGPVLCRRHPGTAQLMWHVNVDIHDPARVWC